MTLTDQERSVFADKMHAAFRQRQERERAWHSRPKVHPEDTFEDSEHGVELSQMLGSAERLSSFKKLLDVYAKKPTNENYVRLRRDFPEVEIEIGLFGGPDPFFALLPQFEKYGIDSGLISGVLDVFEPDIDELSLKLMELLVAKDRIPKSGPGHINERRNAIPEAFVDYVIAMMLESIEDADRPISLPPSLIALIRDRLCGSAPDLHKEYVSREQQKRPHLDIIAALVSGKQPSLRKIGALYGVGKTTVARWVADVQRRWRVHEKNMEDEVYRRRIEARQLGAEDISLGSKNFANLRFKEAKNISALDNAWQTHVVAQKDIISPTDYAECLQMYERRKLQIVAGAH